MRTATIEGVEVALDHWIGGERVTSPPVFPDARRSWEEGVGIVISDLYKVISDLYKDDAPVRMAPRYVLPKAVRDLSKLGYRAKIGLELEAYLMVPDESGGHRPVDTPGGYVYGTVSRPEAGWTAPKGG